MCYLWNNYTDVNFLCFQSFCFVFAIGHRVRVEIVIFFVYVTCGGENVQSRSEEIRQSNCNAYITVPRIYMSVHFSAPYEYIYERIFLRIIYTRISGDSSDEHGGGSYTNSPPRGQPSAA
jgi:hypothetical protein